MHAAEDTFVSLAELLRPRAAVEEIAAPQSAVPAAPDAPRRACTCTCTAGILRDVRVFRAQLADAFDAERIRLLRELAYAVLGRELLLAAPDLAAIVARVVAEHPGAELVRVRVAPSDVHALTGSAPPAIVADAGLAPGDAIVELSDAAIDARLGIRVAALFEPS